MNYPYSLELKEAYADADKWYEKYLCVQIANSRMVKEIQELRAELLKMQHLYELTSEMLEEIQQRELMHG